MKPRWRGAPRFALARVNLAGTLGAGGRWRAAIQHLQAALEIQPDNATALAALGVALVNTGELAAAVPVFERAVQLTPDAAELHQNFGQLLRALGVHREALEHLEKAAELQRSRR